MTSVATEHDNTLTETTADNFTVDTKLPQGPDVNPPLDCRPKTKLPQEPHVNPPSDCGPKTKLPQEPHVNPPLDCGPKTKLPQEPHVNPPSDCGPKTKLPQEPRVNPPSNCGPKTKLPQEPRVNPPLDCRPKVFPGTSKLSPTVSDSKSEETKTTKVKLSFDCDENFECEVIEEDEEAAITQWRMGCPKNPGHREFIPTKEFSLVHLPEGYRKPVFLKGIKSVADLTVRLGVSYTSTDRPDTDHFAKYKGKSVKRTGSGFVCTALSRRRRITMKGFEFPEYFMCDAEEDGLNDGSFNKTKLDEMIDFVGEHLRKFFLATPEIGTETWWVLLSSHDLINAIKTAANRVVGAAHEYLFESLMALVAKAFIPQEALPSQTQTNLVQEVFRIDTFFTLIGGEDFFNEIYKLHPNQNFAERIELISRAVEDNFRASVNMMWTPNITVEIMRKYLEEISTTIQDILGDLDSHHDTNQDDKGNYEGDKEEEEGEEKEEEKEIDDNECAATISPKPKGYLITVMTARHVVFDKEEALKTVVDFFYDDETKEGMVQLHVVDVDVYSDAGDFVTLMCATHDKGLVIKVKKIFVKMSENIKKMKSKSDLPMAVICSHPHGNFKHVTVGDWTTRYKHQKYNYFMKSLYTSYLYKTQTCPGSSGAPVLILGYKDGTHALDSPLHPHHGNHSLALNSSTRLFSEKTDIKELSPKAKQRALKHRQEHERKMQEECKTLKKEVTHLLLGIKKQVMHVPARPHSWIEDFINRLSCMVKANDLKGVSNLKKELLQLKRGVSAASTVPDQHGQATSCPLLKRQDSIPLD